MIPLSFSHSGYRMNTGERFVQVPQTWVRDRRLTIEARAILTELLSNASGFTLSMQRLAHTLNATEHTVRKGVAVLLDLGYLAKIKRRDDRGRLRGTDYELRDPHGSTTLPTSTVRDEDHRDATSPNFGDLATKKTKNYKKIITTEEEKKIIAAQPHSAAKPRSSDPVMKLAQTVTDVNGANVHGIRSIIVKAVGELNVDDETVADVLRRSPRIECTYEQVVEKLRPEQPSAPVPVHELPDHVLAARMERSRRVDELRQQHGDEQTGYDALSALVMYRDVVPTWALASRWHGALGSLTPSFAELDTVMRQLHERGESIVEETVERGLRQLRRTPVAV